MDVRDNTAGIMPAGPFLEETDAISDAQIDVNLRGVVLGCKLALPEMVRARARAYRQRGFAGRRAAAAGPGRVLRHSSSAVVGLTKSLREEYRDSGVHFSSILPSKVTTELASGTERAARGVPTVGPEEVAAAVVEALEQRLTEVAVPRYLGIASGLLGITPQWAMRRFRNWMGDRRVLTKIDHGARAGYNARIARLAEGKR